MTVTHVDNPGVDDTFTVYVEVRYSAGSTCASWTLTVSMGGS